MKPGSPFRRLHEPDAFVRFTWEGEEIVAAKGDTLAAALLAEGVVTLRATPVSGAPRAPYCMMGSCFECLVEVDGTPAVQACMTPVRDGMTVRRQMGRAEMADE